jgi:hypothetical protein
MLSRAFAAGVQQEPVRSKSSNVSTVFCSDYPFPCLLNPEDGAEHLADTQCDDTIGQDQNVDDDVFDWWDGLDGDINSLRVASNTQRYAAPGPGQSRLVSDMPAWHHPLLLLLL